MSQTAVICGFRIQCYAIGLQHFNKVTDLCGRSLNTCTHSTVQKSSATPVSLLFLYILFAVLFFFFTHFQSTYLTFFTGMSLCLLSHLNLI